MGRKKLGNSSENKGFLCEKVLQILDLHSENQRLGRNLINISKIANNLEREKRTCLKKS